MSTEIVEVRSNGEIVEVRPGELMDRAQQAANACKKIIGHCTQRIQGRDYLRVEGWQALAAVSGCTPRIRRVDQIEGGISAFCEIVRNSDGQVIGEGEGFVGNDESTWAKRPLFARRAMAQTRATSRACRVAFAHLVVLLDPKISTTPAEEMDQHDEPAPQHAKATSTVINPTIQAKQPAKPDANGVYPSGVTVNQLKQIGELIKATGSDRNQLLKEFGDPSVKEASYHLMLSHLNRKVAEMEGGKEDAEELEPAHA